MYSWEFYLYKGEIYRNCTIFACLFINLLDSSSVGEPYFSL